MAERDPRRSAARRAAELPPRFTEKDFYLGEFRGRTVAFALAGVSAADRAPLDAVLRELDANGTRSLLVGAHARALRAVAGIAPVEASRPGWVGELWRAFRTHPRGALLLGPGQALARTAADVALRLQLAKLVWIDARGGLEHPPGERLSFVDLPTLDALIAEGRHRDLELLREIRRLLAEGFPAVTLCSAGGLAEELFTYAGSGTFFTRERYARIRHLALDEFEAAYDLIQRGVEEGYLLPRSDADLESVLGHAYGVFVEGRFLAGIGALIPYPEARAAEIASLYTLTRFVGEGVGGHLVRFARDRAVELGLRFLFACTTSERVARFFVRNGFRPAGHDEIPEEKWRRYDADRRERLHCFRLDLQGGAEE